MAYNDTLHHEVHLAYRKKRFVQAITAGTSAGSTTLNAAAADGTVIPPGALYVLQGSADFRYEFGKTANASISSSNAPLIAAGVLEPCEADVKDGTQPNGTQPILSHIAPAAATTVLVFVVV